MKTTLLGIPITLTRLQPTPKPRNPELDKHVVVGPTTTHDRGVQLQVGPLKLGVRTLCTTLPRTGNVAVRVAALRFRVDNFAITFRTPTGTTYSRIAWCARETAEDGGAPVIFRYPPDGAEILTRIEDFGVEMYLPDYLPNLSTLRQGFSIRAERV